MSKKDAQYILENEILFSEAEIKEAKEVLDFARDIPIEKVQNFNQLKEKNEYFIEEEL